MMSPDELAALDGLKAQLSDTPAAGPPACFPEPPLLSFRQFLDPPRDDQGRREVTVRTAGAVGCIGFSADVIAAGLDRLQACWREHHQEERST